MNEPPADAPRSGDRKPRRPARSGGSTGAGTGRAASAADRARGTAEAGPAGSGGTRPAGAGGAGVVEGGGGDVPAHPDGLAGPELARAVLDAARAKRGTQGRPQRRTGGSSESGGPDGTRRRLRGYSGPGPDPRDPQLFGVVLERLVKARGWQKPAAEATVFGAWEKVVGPDIAAHCRPVKLADGELTVEAESTAWATQLRLLAASLLKRIAGEVGNNVVTKLHIHGPAAPSWSRGPRRVQGRGPRDTYG